MNTNSSPAHPSSRRGRQHVLTIAIIIIDITAFNMLITTATILLTVAITIMITQCTKIICMKFGINHAWLCVLDSKLILPYLPSISSTEGAVCRAVCQKCVHNLYFAPPLDSSCFSTSRSLPSIPFTKSPHVYLPLWADEMAQVSSIYVHDMHKMHCTL